MTEAKLQAIVIRWLRNKDFYVIKCQVPPAPVGSPDILALYFDWWIALEVKSSPKAKYQPLQRETIEKLDKWNWCKVIYPENYKEVLAEIEAML